MKDITVSTGFSTTHRDASEGLHLHGHAFTARVTAIGTESELPNGAYDLKPDLMSVVTELHLRSLDDMLVGGSQSFDGIAAWIMERLLLRHPRIVRVEIETEAGVVVGVTREIR